MNETLGTAHTDYIPVTSRDDWFSSARQFRVAPGCTLSEILDAAGIPGDLQPNFGVAINGHLVPPARRRLVRPKPGTREQPVVVTIHPPELRGGNRGTAKNVVTVVAALALVAGTAFIGAGGLGTLLGIAAIGPGVDGATLKPGTFGGIFAP